jgi:hypothetical protein
MIWKTFLKQVDLLKDQALNDLKRGSRMETLFYAQGGIALLEKLVKNIDGIVKEVLANEKRKESV